MTRVPSAIVMAPPAPFNVPSESARSVMLPEFVVTIEILSVSAASLGLMAPPKLISWNASITIEPASERIVSLMLTFALTAFALSVIVPVLV